MRTLSLLVLFPSALAKSLFSLHPANSSDIIRTAYPIGNGKLGILPFGEAGNEKLNINRDSLWSGGPFENTSYRGGNPAGERFHSLPAIRDWIWQNGTGNVSKLMGDGESYGSYAVLANLSVVIDGVAATSYRRTLDLETGKHVVQYRSGEAAYKITTYCSHPDDICVYDIVSDRTLPKITLSFENTATNTSLVNTTCADRQIRLRGKTQADIGMVYEAVAKVIGQTPKINYSNHTMIIEGTTTRITVVIAAGTDFDQTKGNVENNFSFRGNDPSTYVQDRIDSAAKVGAANLEKSHVSDYAALANAFILDLPDTQNSSNVETNTLVARYNSNLTSDPYLESLSFDYARHLFISSSRDGSLPPNLQGRWATELTNEWGSDYHANINLQMNHWGADQTGLGSLQTPLWKYMQHNWAPRGAITARLLYNAPGWVVHNEMNIFGFGGMKTGDEIWADYPVSAAWMMQHVWDYYEYSQDVTWLQETGYPLLASISEFWLSELQDDQYFKDGTLVVNPCTSAEHGPTTFGCTHYQQLLHQLFETTLEACSIVGSLDSHLPTELLDALAKLDTGLHVGSWGQIQEWKLDLDRKNDTHRHLSNLIGWYPGWSIASYADGYKNNTIRDAVRTTLESRGLGIVDANAGWEKVWRAAAWARLNDADKAYRQIRLTIGENWAPNLLSMYSGKKIPFQIDANFGFTGAVLSMLVVDLPLASDRKGLRTVVLGPAIPKAWGNGSVRGLRLRGGAKVDFKWDSEGIVQWARLFNSSGIDLVNKEGKQLVQCE